VCWENKRIGNCMRSIVDRHRIDRRVGFGSEKGRSHRNVVVAAAGSCSPNNPSLQHAIWSEFRDDDEEEIKSTDTGAACSILPYRTQGWVVVLLAFNTDP